MNSIFRSLSIVNYRIWFFGALVSNIGTWMQRTAQDWIVLTMLTDHDATAVGVTMALQLGPQLFISPYGGVIADRFDKRKVLLITQAVMGLLGIVLGILVLMGVAELWHVYLLALLLGVASAIDAPARQAFVSELVDAQHLSNAVALNSASFNGARLIGPAVSGLLTVAVGPGWVFILNAFTFPATIVALLILRKDKLHPSPTLTKKNGSLRQGIAYVAHRPDVIVILIMVFLIGTFGMNFPIYISTFATTIYHRGADANGVLSSVMAIGSLVGSLMAARRDRPRWRTLVFASAAFGLACAASAIAPTYLLFSLGLILVGFTALTFMTTANAMVQTTVAPSVRGRVMALYMAIFMGGTPVGAPVVGWLANVLGPRWGCFLGGSSGLIAAAIALGWLMTHEHVRVRFTKRRIRLTYDGGKKRKLRRAEAARRLAEDEAVARRG